MVPAILLTHAFAAPATIPQIHIYSVEIIYHPSKFVITALCSHLVCFFPSCLEPAIVERLNL